MQKMIPKKYKNEAYEDSKIFTMEGHENHEQTICAQIIKKCTNQKSLLAPVIT